MAKVDWYEQMQERCGALKLSALLVGRCNTTTTQKCLAMSYKTRHDKPVIQLQSLQEKWKYMSRKYLYKNALATLLIISKTGNSLPVEKGICSMFLFIQKTLLISKREHTTEPCNSMDISTVCSQNKTCTKEGNMVSLHLNEQRLPGAWEW